MNTYEECIRDAANLLKGSLRVVALLGAGASTSSGLPDFRSHGCGIFSRTATAAATTTTTRLRPQAAFELAAFRVDPRPFFLLAKDLFPGTVPPTAVHCFLNLLHERGQLLRVLTQNVDGLETAAGLPRSSVVHAHGSFDGAHCIDCGRQASSYAVLAAAHGGDIATCESCGGYVKPDIIFYGERLPAAFHASRVADLPQADLLLIIGTSLSVEPFASVIGEVHPSCPRLLLNRVRVPALDACLRPGDAVCLGECDALVRCLAGEMGLRQVLEERVVACKAEHAACRPYSAVAQAD